MHKPHIPCKGCLILPICQNKDLIRCDIIYKYISREWNTYKRYFKIKETGKILKSADMLCYKSRYYMTLTVSTEEHIKRITENEKNTMQRLSNSTNMSE